MIRTSKLTATPLIIMQLPSSTITHSHPNLTSKAMHHPYIDAHAWPSLPIKPNPNPVPANIATSELHDTCCYNFTFAVVNAILLFNWNDFFFLIQFCSLSLVSVFGTLTAFVGDNLPAFAILRILTGMGGMVRIIFEILSQKLSTY